MQYIDEQLREKKYPNCTRLAKYLDVTTKSIQRDIEFMRNTLGAPIEYNNKVKGYFYIDGWNFLPTMYFNELEAKSLMATRAVLAQYQGAPYYSEISGALDKVLHCLPEALTEEHFLDVYSFARTSAKLPSPEYFTKLEKAIKNHSKVRISYEALRTGEQTERVVHPYRLHLFEDTWFLIAICELRKRPRAFILRRIKSLEVLNENYDMDPCFDSDKYLETRMFLFIEGDGKNTVKIWFSSRLSEWIKERKWHPNQEIIDNSDGSLILSMHVDAFDVVVCWIMQFGVDAEVLEPAELRKKIVRECTAISQRYGKTIV